MVARIPHGPKSFAALKGELSGEWSESARSGGRPSLRKSLAGVVDHRIRAKGVESGRTGTEAQ